MATVPTAGERPQSLCADVAGYDQEAEVCDVIILLNICYAVGGKLIVVLSSVIDGHAGSAIKVLVAIHYSVLDARNGYIRNVVV